MHNSAEVIPEMLAEGIRFLIYAGTSRLFLPSVVSASCVILRNNAPIIGNADFMCNL